MPKTATSNAACRRRGRPVGRNRIPLSLAERRARNAQYERERRNETSDAMAQLAEAAECDISMSNGDLLASVLARLQAAAKRKSSEDIETLRCCNEKLMQQIAELEQRLGWTSAEDNKEKVTEYRRNSKSNTFKRRKITTERQETFNSHEELKVCEQETFETILLSSSRESSPEA